MSRNLYKQEEIEWLRNNVDNYYYEDLVKTFNQVFNQQRTMSSIYNTLRNNKIVKTQKIKNQLENLKDSTIYNSEHKKWLKENCHLFKTATECLKVFNEYFNLDLTYVAFNHLTHRTGILFRSKPTKLNKEQKKWILDKWQKYNGNKHYYTDKLCEDFEKIFNIKITHQYVTQFLENNGKKKPYSNPNHFKYPIGNERKIGRKYTIIKVNDLPNPNKDRIGEWKHNYRKKSHILYEQYHNVKIDDDTQIVIHIDGNTDNFDKENLYLLSKKAERILVGFKFKNEDRQTRLNAIKVSEILALIKE